jgi:hypothetical protein
MYEHHSPELRLRFRALRPATTSEDAPLIFVRWRDIFVPHTKQLTAQRHIVKSTGNFNLSTSKEIGSRNREPNDPLAQCLAQGQLSRPIGNSIGVSIAVECAPLER